MRYRSFAAERLPGSRLVDNVQTHDFDSTAQMMLMLARVALILFGLGLVTFGVFHLVVPRARFVSSNPAPRSSIADPPATVTITFSNKLAPESNIDVASTIRLLPSGEREYLAGRSVVTRSAIDPSDPSGKSMRADLQPGLHQGLYWVSWRTTAARWRTVTYGRTAFGVGMPVPDDLVRDLDGATWERNYDWRRRRAVIIGGVLMIGLAILLPFFTQNSGERNQNQEP